MTGIIILAAGASERLGRPKQLIEYKGKNLLQHAAETALAIKEAEVVIVLGANAAGIRASLTYPRIHIADNPGWNTGMASSITTGLRALLEIEPSLQSVIVMLCDQPYADSGLFYRMTGTMKESGKGIVACSYNNIIGVPAMFSHIYFKYLLALKGEEGARKIIYQFMNNTQVIDFPLGGIDIDTTEDVFLLNKEMGL